MKQLLTIALILVGVSAFSQKSGEIIYAETMKLEMKFEGVDAERFKAMMPSERTAKHQLMFNESASIYESYEGGAEDDDKEMSFTSDEGNMVMKIQVANPENKFFADLDGKTTVNKREFMGKNFLITGNSKDLKWKMTGEQKKILDYNCQKAVLQDTARSVVAWFTPQIPVSSGPGEFVNLPGMILEVNIDDGTRVVVAEKVDFKEIESDNLVRPKKGKEVTKEEFHKIVDEKMKEMDELRGGNREIRVIKH